MPEWESAGSDARLPADSSGGTGKWRREEKTPMQDVLPSFVAEVVLSAIDPDNAPVFTDGIRHRFRLRCCS